MELTGYQSKIIFKQLPVNDPLQRCPDITKAKKLLNWEPKTDRKTGILKTFDYFKSLSSEELLQLEHKNFKKYYK